MSKLAVAFWLGLVAATGFTTFKVKYAVQDIEEELNRVRKHTIAVQPAQRVRFAVTADALGRWAFHCHLLYHMAAGMFREVVVA